MGLHTTPYGSFYVQRDLKTGEIIQVLPVQAKDTPDQLPSVGSLGIDENFIESRRATFEANTSRATDSQGRLQRELASAGGRQLLETGRAVIAQRDDHGHSHTQSHSSHSSPSAATYHDGDIDMAYAQPPAAHSSTQYQYSSASSSRHHHQQRDSRDSRSSSSRRGSTMNVNYTHTLSEDPHHQQSLHMHPVRPWPESLPQEHTVNLPPFREIGSARASSHEEEQRRHDDRVSSRGSVANSSSSSSSRNFRSHGGRSSRRSNSTAFSISSMITDSEGGSTYSASEASTPTALSPTPEYYYCNSSSTNNSGYGYSSSNGNGNGYSPAHPGFAALPPMLPTVAGSPESKPMAGYNMSVDAPTYTRAQHRSRSPARHPSFSAPSAPPPPAAAPTAKKQKTVWIIRTLEPRKMAPNGDEYDDYEPQRVKTHVETHVAS